jgi:hypothetical protein
MSDPPDKRPLRIPPGNRGCVLALAPLIFAYGIWVMASGRVGKGGIPIEGPLAVAMGAVFVVFAGAMFLIAWSERGRNDT